MPAHIILVHDDQAYLAALESQLSEAGHEIAAFENPVRAYDVLTGSGQVQVLVTRVAFQPGHPNGLALANAARVRRPALKVIFLARPEIAPHVRGEGKVFIMPVDPKRIAESVKDLLNTSYSSDVCWRTRD